MSRHRPGMGDNQYMYQSAANILQQNKRALSEQQKGQQRFHNWNTEKNSQQNSNDSKSVGKQSANSAK